jgi:hypothetical protein
LFFSSIPNPVIFFFTTNSTNSSRPQHNSSRLQHNASRLVYSTVLLHSVSDGEPMSGGPRLFADGRSFGMD